MVVNPDGRKERWRAHRVQRRAELIAAAIDAVRAGGAGVGMDGIAAASGIAKPVFYRYFADKADLFLAIGQVLAEGVVRDVTDAIDRETEPRRMLAAGIDAYLRGIEAEPELYRFVVRQPSGGALADPVRDYATVVGLHAARRVHELLRQVGQDAGAAEPWGFGLVGLVRAAADRWLDQQSMSRAALADYLTTMAWDGLAATAVQGVVSDATGSAPRARPGRRA
ncbi:MAG: TetR/AcrR family transcriptional regulator [Actinomycetota bacterium]|nr:TetR/AcrR family transcriptional regulator [Actinomycetota bacterium]